MLDQVLNCCRATLEEVKAAARTVIENKGTVGVAFDRCTIPGSDNRSLLPAHLIELGLGKNIWWDYAHLCKMERSIINLPLSFCNPVEILH